MVEALAGAGQLEGTAASQSREHKAEEEEELWELGMFSLEKRRITGTSSPYNSLTGGWNQVGGEALLPGNKKKWPQVTQGAVQIGY